MKINKTKFVVAALVICSTGALVGSISSTIAWYQYSSRLSAVYLGATAGSTGRLKLRIKGTDAWVNDLTYLDIRDYLVSENKGQAMTPITSGIMGADDAIKTDNEGKMVFYENPDFTPIERVDYDNASWRRANETMYASIPLELCYAEFDGTNTRYLERDIYISDLLIQADWQNLANPANTKKDLSGAVRVHISSYQSNDQSANHVDTAFNRLISKNGGTILTEGYLDLDGDGDLDEYITGPHGANYGFGNENDYERHYITYGEGHQVSYSSQKDIIDYSYKELDETVVNDKAYPTVVKTVGDSNYLDEDSYTYTKEGETAETSNCIGKTVAFTEMADEAYLNVVMTIWVEGWEPLPSPTNADPDAKSPIWHASDYIGSMFDVGIEFATQIE